MQGFRLRWTRLIRRANEKSRAQFVNGRLHGTWLGSETGSRPSGSQLSSRWWCGHNRQVAKPSGGRWSFHAANDLGRCNQPVLKVADHVFHFSGRSRSHENLQTKRWQSAALQGPRPHYPEKLDGKLTPAALLSHLKSGSI